MHKLVYYVYLFIDANTNMHTYIHTYMHTYIHTSIIMHKYVGR